MVRTHPRKSTYTRHKKEHILKALKAIKVDSKSLSKVADEYGIKVSTLYYHLNRYKDYDFNNDDDIEAHKSYNQDFPEELENEFYKEFVDATDYCLGLGPMNIRKFAYEFAMQHELDLRDTWGEDEAASENWLNAFMKLHPSIVNISSYNAHSIQMYFKNYEDLLEKYGFKESQIFKADEIAFTTAKQANRVFARHRKEESELQFLGRDELITMVSTISASGSALEPMFIIPRTSFVSDMIEKALEGSIKVSNKSGWMTKSDFLEYLAHFVKASQCNKTAPCLLMLDNHACSLTLEAIAYAKQNGVFLLILPLHTYNKLQPLNDKVFVKLRFKVSSACRVWVDTNKNKPMKIKDLLTVVESVFPEVFTSSDIKMGFKSSNIYPVNSSNFNDKSISVSKDVNRLNDNDGITSNIDPVAMDTDSVEKDADPVEEDANTVKKETDLAEKDADPVKKDTDSVENDADLVEKDVDPVEEDADTVKKETVLAEKDAVPVKKDTDSVENDADLVEKDTDPVKKETDFVEKNADLAMKDTDSVEKSTDSFDKDADPVEKDINSVEEGTVERDSDPVKKDTDSAEKDSDHVEKEELETADEVVVIYSPKDSNSIKKIPLSKIQQMLGINLTSDNKDNGMTKTEQKENIEDHRAPNESEQKSNSKQVNQDEDVINEEVSNTSKKNKLDKSNRSETDTKKRRKPNSKLSDYVYY